MGVGVGLLGSSVRAWTVRPGAAVCVSEPDVPVSRIEIGPSPVEANVVTVNVAVPPAGTVVELKDALAPAMAPIFKVTALLKVPDGVTEIVYVAVPPGITVCEAGDAEIVKPGVAPAWTVVAFAVLTATEPPPVTFT
jgi:hypothetical protein